MENIVKINHLNKEYKKVKVLDDINLEIKRGEIYGFVGQNGAGKSTFIKIITGLVYPTSGSIELFGETDNKKIQNSRKKIGALVETPAIYNGMSAYENLDMIRIQRGNPDKKIIEETIELVGLTDCGKKKAKNFSLGMRQRLGIGIALIGTPELLFLDEPINGLDPIGIVEIRKLLKRLNDEKDMTIFISSHILEELYNTATQFIFIKKGKIVERLSHEQLDLKCKRCILIKCNDTALACAKLEEKLGITQYKVMLDQSIHIYQMIDSPEIIAKCLQDENILIYNLAVKGDSLEDYFIQLMGSESIV